MSGRFDKLIKPKLSYTPTWTVMDAEDGQVVHQVLVVGRIQRFFEDAPTYAEVCGARLGAISNDRAAKTKVEEEVRRLLINNRIEELEAENRRLKERIEHLSKPHRRARVQGEDVRETD